MRLNEEHHQEQEKGTWHLESAQQGCRGDSFFSPLFLQLHQLVK
jgi:hypothetical protein